MANPDNNVIPGFRKMSKQRILDMARAHINRTRVASINRTGDCVYGGSGCNAAPLLVKGKRSALDRLGSWNILVTENKVPTNNKEFIVALQNAHDNAAHYGTNGFIPDYNKNMRLLAKKFNLNYTPIM